MMEVQSTELMNDDEWNFVNSTSNDGYYGVTLMEVDDNSKHQTEWNKIMSSLKEAARRLADPKSSRFYLERVGFEKKVNMRCNLRFGENIVGRSDVNNVDIRIQSLLCSRRHCKVTVYENSVVVEDLRSSNGTTVNGVRMMDERIELQMGDIIGIVCSTNSLLTLTGNPNFFYFRLCKYGPQNLETYEIEDEDPIELSDNET